MYFKASGSYTHIYLDNGNNILVSKKLAYFNSLEEKSFFFKCHRSYILNINFVRRFSKGDTPLITLQNNEELPLSKSKRHAFEQRFFD